MEISRRYPLSSFFALVFVYSWLWWAGLYVLAPNGAPGGAMTYSVLLSLYGLLGAQGSGVTGVVLTRVVGSTAALRDLVFRLRRWKVGLAWYGAMVLVAPLAVLAASVSLGIIMSPRFLPRLPGPQNIAVLVGTGLFIGLVAGFLEEFGWTGFALPRLLVGRTAFSAALILGVVWSAWHVFPSIWGLAPSYAPLGFLGLVFGITGFATLPAYRILMSWVYLNTKRSLLAAIVMHALYDASLFVFLPALLPIEAIEFHVAFAGILWLSVGLVVLRFGGAKLTGNSLYGGENERGETDVPHVETERYRSRTVEDTLYDDRWATINSPPAICSSLSSFERHASRAASSRPSSCERLHPLARWRIRREPGSRTTGLAPRRGEET